MSNQIIIIVILFFLTGLSFFAWYKIFKEVKKIVDRENRDSESQPKVDLGISTIHPIEMSSNLNIQLPDVKEEDETKET